MVRLQEIYSSVSGRLHYCGLWRRSCNLNILVLSYVFYCGASKASNLGIVRGENPRVVWIKNAPVLFDE